MRFLAIFFVLLSFLLVGCSSEKNEVEYQKIKFDSLVLQLPKNYILVKLDNNLVDKFEVEQAYKEQNFSWFSSSLIISRYIWQYPSDKKKFFSIVSDKFLRKVPWSKILSENGFSIWDVNVYYFTYSVSNDLFDESKADYYWLQAYFFEPNEVYVLNYLTSSKEKLEKFIDLLKNIKLLK